MNKRDTVIGTTIVGVGIVGGLMKGLFYSAPQKAAMANKMVWGSGDYTGDGNINLNDWQQFSRCLWGPKLKPSGYDCWSDTTCGVFDIEKECDVDLADFIAWERIRQP